MGIQRVLEDLYGSTCLRSRWILISHIKLLSETFLLRIYFPAGFIRPCTWRTTGPCPSLAPLKPQAQPVHHQSSQTGQGIICTVHFKKISTIKSQQKSEQLTKLWQNWHIAWFWGIISVIDTSYAFISSSVPHQPPARLNHFSWKMRNRKSSRLTQQQSSFRSGNTIDK